MPIQKEQDNKDDNEIPIPQEENSLLKEAFIFLWEIIKVVVISLAIILPIRYFLIQPFYVKGESMEPNFYDHEYLIVDQISYRFREPIRGEIVVFRAPPKPDDFFIKRIIALPGEKIRVRDGKIIIFNNKYPEGKELFEPYLIGNVNSLGTLTETLDKDEYFIMGDNRAESMDSRSFGPVKRRAIIGRVFFRGWPLDKITIFNDLPHYGL